MTKRRKPPKLKPATSDIQAWPFMVIKRGQMPKDYKYFTSITAARTEILGDLEDLRDRFIKLQTEDAIAATSAAIAHVQQLTAAVSHNVDVLIDPYTNTHYRAEIVRRQAA